MAVSESVFPASELESVSATEAKNNFGSVLDRVLSRGQSIEANIDNGTNECQYDLRAVMADGREVIRRNINVCAVSKWTIGDSGDSIG